MNIIDLKHKATRDLYGAITEVKANLNPHSDLYDTLMQILGNLEDINNTDTLIAMLTASYKQQGKDVGRVEENVLSFYSIQKNRIRGAFLSFLNHLEPEDWNGSST
ncbi:MAG: hypothetical protein AAF587_26950 [Bacteroidota bacterium]